MGYKEQFHQLCDEKKLEEARLLLMKNDYEAYDDPFYFTNMGWVLNGLERYQEALLYLNKALEVFGEDAWVYAQMGLSYVRLQQYQEAIHNLKKALDMHYDENWMHGELGHCYLQLKQNEEAINYLENALMDEPYNVWYMSQVAHAYLELKQYDLALEYYQKAAKYDPCDDTYYDMAYYYSKVNDFSKQLQYLMMISDDFDLPWKNYQIAVVYLKMNEAALAIKYVLKAIKLGIDDLDSHQLLADAYMLNDEYEQAIKEYQYCLNQVTSLNKYMPSRANHQELVWIAHKMQDWNLKLQYLNEAKANGYEDVWFYYHYARCYSELHEHEQAIHYIQLCMNDKMDEVEMKQLLGWNLGRLKRHQEAYDVLIEAEAKCGGNSWFDEEIGMNLMSLKRYDEAIVRLLKIKQTPYYISMIGFCYYHLNEYDQAIKYLEEAIQLNKQDTWVYAMCARCYQLIDDINHAIHYYQIAHQKSPNELWIKEELESLKK